MPPRLVVIANPTDPIVSLEEVKGHLRLESDDHDADILSKIWGAISEFEDPNLGWLGRSISPRNLEVRLDRFCEPIALPNPPILVGAEYPLTVKYDDEDGAEQTLSDDVYRLVDGETNRARLRLKTDQNWPDLLQDESSVRVRYWAGYAPGDVRADNFKSAVKLHVQMTFDGDEEEKLRLAKTIDRLLSGYRIFSL